MASANEELPPPKPRTSPLHYRNTDLVSRLLAATPPYLYNMPLVPHSFFFSEMLRSLVQAKTDHRPSSTIVHQRRSRKRPWNQHADYFHKDQQAKMDKREVPATWTKQEDIFPMFNNNKEKERPLELTIDKVPLNNNNTKPNYYDTETKIPAMSAPSSFPQDKHPPFPFPAIPTTPSNPEVVLPPPPPVWYPPLYPTPYGIDPLHFFIDLRVSGHIYDKKNQKEASETSPQTSSTTTTSFDAATPPPMIGSLEAVHDAFKQPRHSSAFSVPSVLLAKNGPINLSNYSHKPETKVADTKMKFDVKSMGFEKTSNKLNATYVMSNVGKIYKELRTHCKIEEADSDGRSDDVEEISVDTNDVEETEEEREKRVRDLRALIGLELVVDYMNHSKPPGRSSHNTEDVLSADHESNDSCAVDVVAVQDDL